MEAQLQRPSHGHHHHHEGDTQNAGLRSVMEGEGDGEQQHHGQKKSVLKKVKDKAKKIKDTIKKHGHGHEHEGGHRREDIYHEGYEEEEEDEDGEEAVEDPEVHGAPMYESTVIRSVNLPRETNTNLEKPTDSPEDRYEHDVRDEGVSRPFDPGHRAPESERTPATEAHVPGNKDTMRTGPDSIDRDKPNVDEQKIKLKPPGGLEEDPHSLCSSPSDITPSNYQSKGGKEAEVAPLAHQFDNLNVRDAAVSKPESEQRPGTATHDQFTPQPTRTKNLSNPESDPIVESENPELNPKSQDPANARRISEDTNAGKISSTTSAVANRAVSTKNMVASKLGYGGGHEEGRESSSEKPVSETASEYAHKVAEALAPVYEKVAGAGGAVMSKVHGSGGAEHQGGDTTAAEGANSTMSMKEYLSEKFRPGAEDKALSETITNALQKKKEAVQSTGEEQQGGKVTVSEEVAARLGTTAENKREGDDALAAGQESSGHGVVDRLKDAVGSWLGRSAGTQTAQESVGRSYVSDATSGSTGFGRDDEVNAEHRNPGAD